jgi:hypothetical protein
LIAAGRVEETIHFSPSEQSFLTYALVCESGLMSPQVRSTAREIVIALPQQEAATWAGSDLVGIYATINLGLPGALSLSVEKDFACMDLSDADDLDTFQTPS